MKKITQHISGENAQQVILKHMEEKRLTQKELSRIMGESPQNLSQQLHRQKDMKMRRFVEVMEYLGYEILAVERDYRRVSPQVASEIVETGSPHGLFWSKEKDVLFGIDNTGSELFCEEFTDMNEMKKWFSNEPCVNAEGFEVN